MKYNITKNDPPKKFEPLTLTFTIENKKDLYFWRTLMNPSKHSLIEFLNEHIVERKLKEEDIEWESYDMYSILTDFYNEL